MGGVTHATRKGLRPERALVVDECERSRAESHQGRRHEVEMAAGARSAFNARRRSPACGGRTLWPEYGTETGGDKTQTREAKDKTARIFAERVIGA